MTRFAPRWIALAAVVLMVSGGNVFADPAGLGLTVTTYASGFPSELETLSFDSTGVVFVGSDPGGGIYRVPVGGGAYQESWRFGPDMPDQDAVIVDDGSISGIPGAVLVGGNDDGGGYVVAIHPDGSTTTPIWSGSSAFGDVGDFAFDMSGRLLFTDPNWHGLMAYDPASDPGSNPPPTVDPVLLGDHTGNGPYRLAVDSHGWAFTTTSDGTIKVYGSDGGLLNDGFVTGFGDHAVIAFDSTGSWGTDLYALNRTAGELWRFEVLDDASLGLAECIGTGFDWGVPTDMLFGPGDALYISLHGSCEVLRVTPEPSTLAMLGCVGAVFLKRRRR